MNPERWQQISTVFHEALLLTANKRAVLLDEECADDLPLRTEIQSLLDSHKNAGDIFEQQAIDVTAKLLANQQTQSLIGQQIKSFKIVSLIGTGGMGEVYLAEDTNLGRKVAIKVLSENLITTEEQLKRFQQEARSIAALNHPNIITIHEFGQHEGLFFIVTEYVKGETLRRILSTQTFTLNTILDVALQIADALAAAHSNGIIHRDVKPENVMLRGDGYIKVLDFGLAKLVEKRFASQAAFSDVETQTTLHTIPGILLGTISYMSPEQLRGFKVDGQTDIWSLGVLLYEMLTGQLPFCSETPSDCVASILKTEPLPLSHFVEDIPETFEQVVMNALKKDKNERYKTITELQSDLRQIKKRLELDAVSAKDIPNKSRIENRSEGNKDLHQTNDLSGEHEFFVSPPDLPDTDSVPTIEMLSTTFSMRTWGWITACIVALFLGYALVYEWRTHPIPDPDNPLSIRTIAVLPFIDIGEKNNSDSLAEGLPDAMITTLSHIKQLKVRPTSAISKYFGKKVDSLTAGRELNVDEVIEGTIRRDNGNVRVVVRLLRVRDGEQIWSETFTEKVTNALALEKAISLRTAREFGFTLTHAENERFAKRATTNTEAYNAYLKARTIWNRNLRDQTDEVVALYQQAITLDPNFALAYAGLAEAELGYARREANPTRAREYAQKAIALDRTLAEAHTTLARISAAHLWDWTKAENEYKRALELNPNYAPAHHGYAFFLTTKRQFVMAEVEMKKALEIDPFSPLYNGGLCALYYYARRYDEAIAQCQMTQAIDPKIWNIPKALRAIYLQKKLYQKYADSLLSEIPPDKRINHPLAKERTEAAMKKQWEKEIEEQLNLPVKERSIFTLASRYTLLGETEKALTWIEYGCREHILDFPIVNADPVFDDLRSHPRFIKAMQNIGL
jgi:serine/threonine-protein kinase